jgi:CBS domain-containing protein
MIVRNILAGKGSDVVTVNPTADLITAAKAMTVRGIGAVVILGADNRIVGILSERDIVRTLAERGPTVLSEPVSQIMTRDVKTCSENDSISDLMAQMTVGKFRHVPVVQQEKLMGIVSIGDVVKGRVEEMDQESSTLREYIQTA